MYYELSLFLVLKFSWDNLKISCYLYYMVKKTFFFLEDGTFFTFKLKTVDKYNYQDL